MTSRLKRKAIFGVVGLLYVFAFVSPAFAVLIKNNCSASLFRTYTSLHIRPTESNTIISGGCRDKWIQVAPNSEITLNLKDLTPGCNYTVEAEGVVGSTAEIKYDINIVDCKPEGLICVCKTSKETLGKPVDISNW